MRVQFARDSFAKSGISFNPAGAARARGFNPMAQRLHSNRGIDEVTLTGRLRDEGVLELGETIAGLRQKGSRKLILLGGAVEGVSVRHWLPLLVPVKNYRALGGIIVLAGFDPRHLRPMRSASWFRHVNVFDTREEAYSFLDPKRPD